MPKHLRLDAPRERDPRRWTIGLFISSDCRRLSVVPAEATGHGLELQVEVGSGLSTKIPDRTAALFDQLGDPSHTASVVASVDAVAALRTQLAETEADVLGELMAQTSVPPNQVLAVGVHDPGLWSSAQETSGAYLGLCDAARLAELTGLNVIDAFPARDVAAGGQGGPVTSLAEWILLNSPLRNRLLLDLGRSVRMTYLPAHLGTSTGSPILSFDVGPGMRLLDLLVCRLTGGEHPFDPGGRFAVQGRQIEALLEHWLADPYFQHPLPRWRPWGLRPERFLIDSLQMAVESGWSVRDLLCTAVHFVAESVASAIRQRLPADVALDEILLTGGGQRNGMLLSEITNRLPRIPMLPVEHSGIASEAIEPACVAVLALLYLDQVPANHPAVTGTDVPRVLGRLTPGSPLNWQRLLAHFSGSMPAVRPLRSAV